MAVSRDYVKYLEAEIKKENPTWFEKTCNTFGRLFTIHVSKETEKKVSEQLEFTQTKVKVSNVYSTTILFAILAVVFSVPLFLLHQSLFGMLTFAFGMSAAYYISIYPALNVKYYRIRASSDLVLSVLYMVISLRIVPSLENALLFAAMNISGPVGRSLKKIAWDLEIGKVESGDKALEYYSNFWRQENEEFSEAIDIIRTSAIKSGEERNKMYEEAITILLDRNMERMKKYSTQLSTPVTLINYVGVMLPVLTIILFPIMTIFLTQAIKPTLLVIAYDVILPLVVYWLMQQTLMTRPFSFAATKEPVSIFKVLGGLIFTWGIAASIVIYSYFSYRKNIDIKNDVKRTEGEFTEALYEFGIILNSGYSVETSLEKLLSKIKNLKISNLFSMALDRIKKFGLTLERAIFDKELGVIIYYPSQLIFNILRILRSEEH